jgi:hypothetical protein
MWEGTLTYGGANDDPTAEWYLLSLTFLFRVRDARGGTHNSIACPVVMLTLPR